MNIFRSMDISGSALTAQRFRMDVVGENIANATTTRTDSGGPYRRKYVIFEERPLQFSDYLARATLNERTGSQNSAYVAKAGVDEHTGHQYSVGVERLKGRYQQAVQHSGVRAIDIREDPAPFKMQYDPNHPDADEEGYVFYPNVDMEREMVDFISATRSYEANVTAIANFKSIAMKALEIGR